MSDNHLFSEVKTGDAKLLERQEKCAPKQSPYRKQMLMHGSNLELERQDSQNQAFSQTEILTAVKGTCQVLEKPYFRLTSAADPAEVRPEEILEQSLKLMCKKWKKRQNDYRYIDEQFRSMRQDLAIQRIKNSLTVRVYETHARIALEQADLD